MKPLELKENGEYNFDYFSVDFTNDGCFYFGGEKYIIGQFTNDLLNLSKDYRTELLLLSGKLFEIWLQFDKGFPSEELYLSAKETVFKIINKVRDIKPFSYFNIDYSRRIFAKAFNSKNHKSLLEFLKVYIYFANDVANFSNIAMSFFESFMDTNLPRSKENLSSFATEFFTNPEIMKKIDEYNPNKLLAGVTLKPNVTYAPRAVVIDESTALITRRLYFGRLMDFFITELFEAIQAGHYCWRCAVCNRYFLMTSARKQLYCNTVNEEYGVPCSYVAKHPSITKQEMQRQYKKGSPIYDLWKRRSNSIRKNKSLGKYDDIVSAEAKRLIDEKFETAQIDFDYAEHKFEGEMDLDKIYNEAIRNLNGY